MGSAMQAAQLRYDNMTPDDDPPCWLESSQGSDWFDDSVNALVNGNDMRIGRQTKVSADDLYIAVEERFLVSALALEGMQLGNMIKALQLGEYDTAKRCVAEILGEPTRRMGAILADMAEELISPHADAAQAELCDQEDGQ